MGRNDDGEAKDGGWTLVSDILDKIKKTIGVGVDVVETKSKEFWDTTVIRTRISDLKAKRRDLLENLGGLAFEMLSKGSLAEPVLRAKSEAILEIDRQIDAAEAQIRKIREASKEQRASDQNEPAQSVEPEPEPQATWETAQQPDQADQPEQAKQPEQMEHPEQARRPEEPAPPRPCECGARVLEGARFCVACGRPVIED